MRDALSIPPSLILFLSRHTLGRSVNHYAALLEGVL